MATAVTTIDAGPQTISTLLDQLSAEHAELLPHTDRLLQLATLKSSKLSEYVEQCASRLRAPLEEHIAQEDNVLFPAYADRTGEGGVIALFEEEHRNIITLRDELLTACQESADLGRLCDLTARFADLLSSHMNREDMMLFPSARRALCG